MQDKSRPLYRIRQWIFLQTVLGTEFRIRAYADSITSCIQLLSGESDGQEPGASGPDGPACWPGSNVLSIMKRIVSAECSLFIPASPSYRNGAGLDSHADGSSEENDSEIAIQK